MASSDKFRRRVRTKYKSAFVLHADVAALLDSVIAQQTHLRTDVARAFDMLMVQACMAHESVRCLAVRALVEDAATITRRLLEIAVQAGYIMAPPTVRARRERARKYLLFLWKSF